MTHRLRLQDASASLFDMINLRFLWTHLLLRVLLSVSLICFIAGHVFTEMSSICCIECKWYTVLGLHELHFWFFTNEIHTQTNLRWILRPHHFKTSQSNCKRCQLFFHMWKFPALWLTTALSLTDQPWQDVSLMISQLWSDHWGTVEWTSYSSKHTSFAAAQHGK